MRAGVFAVLLATAVFVRNEVGDRPRLLDAGLDRLRAARPGPRGGSGAAPAPRRGRDPVPRGRAALRGRVRLLDPTGTSATPLRREGQAQPLPELRLRLPAAPRRLPGGRRFIDCGRLMARDFGEPRPSLTTAIGANPGAIGRALPLERAPRALRARAHAVRPDLGRTGPGPGLHPGQGGIGGGADRVAPARSPSSLSGAGFDLAGETALVGDWIAPRAWGWLALRGAGGDGRSRG